jgi:hypothetical protein
MKREPEEIIVLACFVALILLFIIAALTGDKP